jgi:tetratricopeptide (TPR) repeat protein
MGDLWIQVVPRHAEDLALLNDDRRSRELAEDIVGSEMVIKADPDQVMEHNEVALLYLQFGKVAEAVAHFRESARLQPESAAAQYNLGTTLTQMGDYEEAIHHLEHALGLDPGYVRARNSLGAALRLQGKLAEAVRHFREALVAQPNDGDTLYNLASALTEQGEIDEAISDYRRVLQVQPDAPDALADLAWLLAAHPNPRFHDPSEAIRLAERASGLTHGQDAAVLDVLAAAYAAAGQFERAIATARAALAALPASASLTDRASSIRHRLDLFEKGRPYRGAR